MKVYLLCSPHNPAGRVWTVEELTRMCDICLKHDVIITDEAKLWLDSGRIFGPATAQFQRFNMACPRATVVKAFDQLKAAIDAH